MKLRKILGFTVVTLALLSTISLEAARSTPQNLRIRHEATLAGTHIASGVYRVKCETRGTAATVTFRKGRKVVVTAEGKVVDRGEKYSSNAVVYATKSDGTLAIQEIRFADQSEVVVFNE